MNNNHVKQLLIAGLLSALGVAILMFSSFMIGKQEASNVKYLNPVVEEGKEYEGFGDNENCREFKSGLYLCSDNSKYDIEQFEDVIEKDSTGEKTRIQKISKKRTFTGVVSYYSEDGCVGCHPEMIMANGEKFDEDAMTLAFNKLSLNTKVEVCNLDNNECQRATVTDTGGFEKLGRIADLSKGLYNKIGAKTDVSRIRIREL